MTLIATLTWDNVAWDLSLFLFSFLLGLATALFLEWIKKPRFSIRIAPASRQDDATYLRVRIENLPVRLGLGCILQRTPALSTYAIIEFYSRDRMKMFSKPIEARWTDSLQPSTLGKDGVVTINELLLLKHRDLFVGRPEDIEIAVKWDNSPDVFVMCNESFITGFKDEVRKLEAGLSTVRVTVISGTDTATEKFIIRNELSTNEFQLENWQFQGYI